MTSVEFFQYRERFFVGIFALNYKFVGPVAGLQKIRTRNEDYMIVVSQAEVANRAKVRRCSATIRLQVGWEGLQPVVQLGEHLNNHS